MENRVQYFTVGVFVFVTFIGLILFLLWQSNYSKDREYKYYKINTQESVSGLNIKAPVRLMGVSIGEVEKIHINYDNTQEVSVIIKVEKSTPIKTDSYAMLKPQGITGLMFLEIEGGTKDAPMLETSSNEKDMGVISARPSLFTRYDATFASLITKFEHTLDIIQSAFDEKNGVLQNGNIKNMEILLKNSAQISQNLALLTGEISGEGTNIKQLIQDLSAASNQLQKTSKEFSSLIEGDASSMVKSVDEVSKSVNSLVSKLEERVDYGEFDMATILQENLQSTQNSMDELNTLIRQLQQSPSDIIFKTNTKPLGPGE